MVFKGIKLKYKQGAHGFPRLGGCGCLEDGGVGGGAFRDNVKKMLLCRDGFPHSAGLIQPRPFSAGKNPRDIFF